MSTLPIIWEVGRFRCFFVSVFRHTYSERASSFRMATVRDVPANEFIVALAAYLKKSNKLDLPQWANIVKTGKFKEMPPMNQDWYFVRAASVARKVYIRQGTGIGALSRVYGGRNRKGTMRKHFNTGSTGLLRHILTNLAGMGLVEKRKDAKGRFITTQGQRELDTIAMQVIQSKKDALAGDE
eukprot:g56532.t1